MKDVVDVLATPVFTRILTKEQYGIFNVYNSWFQIVKILFSLYLFSEVFNVGLVKFEIDRNRFVSSTLGFVTTSVAVHFFLYLFFRNSINSFIGLPWYLIVLLFFHVLVYVPYYCWIRRERFAYNYKNVVIVSILYVILQPVIAIIAIFSFSNVIDPGYVRVLGAVGVQIIIGAVLYLEMMHKGRAFFDAAYWKYSFKTGIQLIPFSLSKVVLNQSDRIMINYYLGSGDTGIYSVAHSAAFVLLAITEALDGAFVPWLYRRLKAKELFGLRNVVNGLVIIVAVCVLGIDIIAPEIMRILGSEAYYQGVYCIPSLVFSVYLIFLYTILSNIELFYEKNSYVAIASIIGMIVNIVLNAVFIPVFGYFAAGYTTLVGYFSICIGHFLLLKKCLDTKKIRITEVLDLKFLAIVSGALLLFTVSCVFLYRWVVVRWSIIVVMIVVLIIKRNDMIKLITRLNGDKNNG